ncbi:ComEC/Rec2 family competence protein [Bifidobacterium avesanii]|uniref:ComEC/Rec2 family competence protein n=1 Tax=Bifidobacterium avesanii TaxID=1798157 RepID=A0A7K3TEK0_9BIFI|nr:ComEC/Rec2 family competence protein [Bifidobacterium avesanii]KAB8295513.1 competence protein [Bifidobacterium avesanii]NEG77518.1 ComEC/Rec2 family competence protein [Bifidobacterium avesanii]
MKLAPDESRERGSRDWRLVPVACGVWASALLCHTVGVDRMPAVLGVLAALTALLSGVLFLGSVGVARRRGNRWENAPAPVATSVSIPVSGIAVLHRPARPTRTGRHAGRRAGRSRSSCADGAPQSAAAAWLRFLLPHITVLCAGMLVAGLATFAQLWIVERGPVQRALGDHAVAVGVGVRVDEPPISSDRRGFDCRLDVTVTALLHEGVLSGDRASARVYATGSDCALRQGGSYWLDGTLERPGFGSAPAWVSVDGTPTELREPTWVRRLAYRAQSAFVHATQRLDPQGRLLVPGLTLGLLGGDVADPDMRDPALPDVDPAYAERVEDAFRACGIMHLMAVSGGHFALIGVLARRLCGLLHVGRPFMPMLVMGAYALLAALMMPADSVLRALVMGGIGAFALLRGRRSQGMGMLCVTVVAAIILDPGLARSLGFALSCAAVAGIVWWARPVAELLAPILPAALAEAVGVTVAAQALALPLQTLMEGQLPVLGVLANLLTAPVVSFSTLAGLLGLALSWWAPEAGYRCAWVASGGTAIMERVALWCAGSPFASLPWGQGPGAACFLLAAEAGMALAVRRLIARRRRTERRAAGLAPGERADVFRPTPVMRLGVWAGETARMLRGGVWAPHGRRPS